MSLESLITAAEWETMTTDEFVIHLYAKLADGVMPKIAQELRMKVA